MMSGQKHEIPAAMLDAATAAIKELRETKGLGFVGSAEIAKIALEAAGVPALIAERDALRASGAALVKALKPFAINFPANLPSAAPSTGGLLRERKTRGGASDE